MAALQREAGAHGIAVAKVGEAEVFAAAGFEDIAIAYPVVGEAKWQRIARLAEHARITSTSTARQRPRASAPRRAPPASPSTSRSTSTPASAAAASPPATPRHRSPSRA